VNASARVRLWSDEPSAVDLLAFGAVAETAVEAVLDDVLDPIALGISGPWGSGKSTVLRLIENDLTARNTTQNEQRVLIVRSEPWRYDPGVGAKATLIGEVLAVLQTELLSNGGPHEHAESALRRLAKRVNWMRALKMAARTSITLQLPSIDDLSSLVSEDNPDGEPESRTLDEFRTEFAALLTDDDLSHLRRVVVLVDDLDRCLPETVVDTLETMRLFLSVPKMSFVIAADEERVADALRDRYPRSEQPDQGEEPAKLYLHKIVQTTLRLPALSRFDTEAFLLLLLIQNRPDEALDGPIFESILASCGELRTTAGTLDSLAIPPSVDIADELAFAARLTPMLYEKLRGSPRRVKRFLNDLNVRSSIAGRRGIQLDIAIVAKLMVLEVLLPSEFTLMLDWLARGELRLKLAELEQLAGRGAVPATEPSEPDDAAADEGVRPKASKKTAARSSDAKDEPPAQAFSDELVRWAKLPPSLTELDLSPYLHLAASFAGTALIDAGLPERLRDIASNLMSESRVSQKSVTDQDIAALPPPDTKLLLEHLGRMGRDRPVELGRAVVAILRVATLKGDTVTATAVLQTIPAKDVKAPVVLQFGMEHATTYRAVLERWAAGTADQHVKNAVSNALAPKVSGH
jgi:hypothetical protein